MTLLRVIVFAVLLAVKVVVPLAPAPQATAEEALGSTPAVESEGEDDDSDVLFAFSLEGSHAVERHHPQAREASRPEDLPAAPEDRPPNA